MNQNADRVKESVITYCASIGKDPLLVQGAGGNISWKDGDTLWVKASGTWIADAAEKNIFVPVDLLHIQAAIGRQDFDVNPKVLGRSALRPSIETLLHALMPHRVVLHLHSVVILSILVRKNCDEMLRSFVSQTISWAAVDYQKPGNALARAISNALALQETIDVIFLKNHGVVIGGESVVDIHRILTLLNDMLYQPSVSHCPTSKSGNQSQHHHGASYSLLPDSEMQALALNPGFFNRLESDWALYPDHVVFLGAEAQIYADWSEFHEKTQFMDQQPELLFVRDSGVYISSSFNKTKQDQLRCYYDTLSLLPSDTKLQVLSDEDISELLNWDAEQYRMSLAKRQ